MNVVSDTDGQLSSLGEEIRSFTESRDVAMSELAAAKLFALTMNEDLAMKITSNEINLILGIQSEKKDVKENYGIKPDTPFIKRRFAAVSRLCAPYIKQQLVKALVGNEDHDFRDFARLCCLYLFVCLFYTNSSHTIGWASFKYVEDINKMKEYAWSSSILDSMMKSIHQKKQKITNEHYSTGCMNTPI
ncbi:hypothetical protein QJS04_geneDACA021138 [Acorus gramineus]|uniref:Uncharacterized protein n=1 Tax=Acorus gramineus TaxID=55184 RepID=A0AAV9BWL9_ACOGR|nr:hypothetical protein QJS04_geneDACA021138 [Acorus gramineus]